MTKAEKLLAKARQNPEGMNFAEFETLLGQHGFIKLRQKGSHASWCNASGKMLIIQPDNAKAKKYQVKQFLELLNKSDK